MTRRLLPILGFLVLTACRTAPVGNPTVTLSIVGTNDLHGALLSDDEGAGGIGVFGGYMNNLRLAREEDGGDVLLIDAGDMWQGTLESNLSEGAVVVAAYNLLGYAAAAVGNHEFDYGPLGPRATATGGEDPLGALKQRAREARFPFLAANIIDRSTGVPIEWENVRSSTRVVAAGLDIGIIGVLSRGGLSGTMRPNVAGLEVAPLAPSIEAEARRLRDAGSDFVIVTAHAGGGCEEFDDPRDLSSCDMDDEIFEVARALPRGLVDVIIAGHYHQSIAHEVNGIAIITAESRSKFFGRVDVEIDQVTGGIDRRIHPPERVCEFTDRRSRACASPDTGGPRARYEGKPVGPDPELEEIVIGARETVARLKGERLGPALETPIRRGRHVESELGNLVVDILFESSSEADLAVYNTRGGLRADLPAGPLTFGSVYEALPFDNRRTFITLTGAQLKKVIAEQFAGGRVSGHVAGLRVEARCEEGGLTLDLTDSSGETVEDDDELEIVSVDFLTTGGDRVFAPVLPPGGILAEGDAPMLRDLVADWFRLQAGSLRGSDFFDGTRERWIYPGELPLECALVESASPRP